MIHYLLYVGIIGRQTIDSKVGDESQRMSQVMQRLLHSCKPVYDVCAPLWIIKLPSVTLHPLAIHVGATATELVFQFHIITTNPILPPSPASLAIRLNLP